MAAKITLTVETLASVLTGDWSDVDAEQLTDIVEAVNAADVGIDNVVGLTDRIKDGPTNWDLELSDDGGSSESGQFEEMDLEEAKSDADEAAEKWAKEGDWGSDGAVVEVNWTLSVGGVEIETGSVSVEIEPDHASLIKAAGGKPNCDDGEGHDWTAEGEGGLTENPGVWSTGGTSMTFKTHCSKCGLQRTEHSTGSQRNPGEHDTVEYALPETVG